MSNKHKRLVFFIASIIFSFGIPLVVTVVKYDMLNVYIKQSATVKLSIIGAIICIVLFVVFFKKIIKYISSKPYSTTLSVAKGVIKFVPLLCAMLLLANMLTVIDDLLFVFGWITGCNFISFVILDPIVDYYTNEVRRDEQRELIKEGVSGNERKD